MRRYLDFKRTIDLREKGNLVELAPTPASAAESATTSQSSTPTVSATCCCHNSTTTTRPSAPSP